MPRHHGSGCSGPRHQADGRRGWWRTAVVYQVYPRSFMDGDGDGHGDLTGLIARLPYLVELGVDALWIAPWYPSPLADGGYDITDYRDIHPMFGTLDDAQRLLERAHRHGLKVLIDLVANHTSREHPWFQQALRAGPGSPERDRYLFRAGQAGGPPNNWISAFGDSAWSRAGGSSSAPAQYYLHTFAPDQPDLNWRNEQVLAEFDDVLRFWLDRGVDGFRLDAVPAMVKEAGFPDAEYASDLYFDSAGWVDNPHWDVDGVHDIMRRWRSVVDEYDDRILLAEAVVNGPERLARYMRPDELHTAFSFEYMHAAWDAQHTRTAIEGTVRSVARVGAPAVWAKSSHDEVRHPTRYGKDAAWLPMGNVPQGETDLELGTRRARALALLTLALPGAACLYQGEELGLPEVEDLPAETRQDPVFARSGGQRLGRDGCRVPLPWAQEGPSYGFSAPGVQPWLPQPSGWDSLSVEAQERDAGSMLMLYRAALRLRRDLADLDGHTLTWQQSPAGVLRFTRGASFLCVVNMSESPVGVPGSPILSSGPLTDDGGLPPNTAVWSREPREPEPADRAVGVGVVDGQGADEPPKGAPGGAYGRAGATCRCP